MRLIKQSAKCETSHSLVCKPLIYRLNFCRVADMQNSQSSTHTTQSWFLQYSLISSEQEITPIYCTVYTVERCNFKATITIIVCLMEFRNYGHCTFYVFMSIWPVAGYGQYSVAGWLRESSMLVQGRVQTTASL